MFSLKNDVESSFSLLQPTGIFEEKDFGHDRIEKRKYSVIPNLKFIEQKGKYTGLQSIAKIERGRFIKQ